MTNLLKNIVLFARLLRKLGINITPNQIVTLVQALDHIDLRQRTDVKNTIYTTLINRLEHRPLFNRAFDLFWQARNNTDLLTMKMEHLTQNLAKTQKQDIIFNPNQAAIDQAKQTQPQEQEDPLLEKVYTYSLREVLRHKDFAHLTPAELSEVKRMMNTMHWHLEQRRTRRKTPSNRGPYFDMRRTFRHNLRYGGELLHLAHRSHKYKQRPLVVISDISGSMERYSRILLKFIYIISNGLQKSNLQKSNLQKGNSQKSSLYTNGSQKMEAFVFSTRLTRITHHLKKQDVDTALNQVMHNIKDWGGGTRIGQALKTFNYHWGRRVLGQGAIVLIISDGWDRGDIDLLAKEMHRLQLSSQRLIWLNPLLGSPNYQPLTRGIQAALPYVDDFLPVHNLNSLQQLGNLLQKLGEHRPSRRQYIERRAWNVERGR